MHDSARHSRFPILVFLALALISLPSGVRATTLPVPAVSQRTPVQYDNWCWAAASQAILSYTGNAPADKCEIVNWARDQKGWGSDDCCTNGTGAVCNRPNSLYGGVGSVEKILANWGADSEPYGRSLTLKEVQDAIEDDSPIIVAWRWTGQPIGHVVVAHGYSGSTIDVMDPWDGPLQLSHANLTSTPDRTWSHSLVVVPKKVTYVVDDTGSMGDEIGSVRDTLLDQVDGFESEGRFVKYTLITYKDAPSFQGSTVDHDEIAGWIQALSADGGGDCPEEGYGALDLAAEKAPGSDIWWMTDADSHGGILRMLQTRFRLLLAGNTLHSSILGSCTSATAASRQADSLAFDPARHRSATAAATDVDAFSAGEALSRATGGLFFAVSSAEINAATSMILEEISSAALLRRLLLEPGSHDTAVPVDASVQALKVLLDVSAGATGTLAVNAPGGGVLNPGSPGVTELVAGQSRMLLIGPPALVPGSYSVATTSSEAHVLSVSAISSHAVSLVGDATAAVGAPYAVKLSVPSLTPATAPAGPGPGGPGGPSATPPEEPAPLLDPSGLSFFAEREDGTDRKPLTLFDDGLHGDGLPQDGIYGGVASFDEPGSYRLGIVSAAADIERVTEVLVSAGAVDVTASADTVGRPGESVTHSFQVKNLSSSLRAFDLAVAASAGWAVAGVPGSLSIGPGATITVEAQVGVPAGTPPGETNTLSLVAAAQDDPAVADSDSATLTAWAGPLLVSLAPNPVAPGQTVVLSGSGYGADPGAGNRSTDSHHVLLAGLRVGDGDVLSWSDSEVSVRVPAGAASGLVHLVSDSVASNDLELVVAAATGLTPAVAFRPLGTAHTVSLTLVDGEGAPASGVAVLFSILSGPNVGASGTVATGADGVATFTYTGNGIRGVDDIRASYVDPATSVPAEATAIVFWDIDCNFNGVADTCDINCAGFGGRCSAVTACGGSTDQDGNGVPDQCLASAVEVPTASTMVLFFLAVALAVAGWVTLRP